MNGKAIQVTVQSLKPGFDERLIPELVPIDEMEETVRQRLKDQITEVVLLKVPMMSQVNQTLGHVLGR